VLTPLPESNLRLSKKDKNLLKIIHSNSTAAAHGKNNADDSSIDARKEITLASRSSSLNYKTVFSSVNNNDPNNNNSNGYVVQQNRSPSPHTNSYVTTTAGLSKLQLQQQQSSQDASSPHHISNIQIKQSKSHPNFSISNNEPSASSSPELITDQQKHQQYSQATNSVKSSPVVFQQQLTRNASREALVENATVASHILPIQQQQHIHHTFMNNASQEATARGSFVSSTSSAAAGSKTSPSNSTGRDTTAYKAQHTDGSCANGAQQLATDDQLPDVIYVAYKKRSMSNNPNGSNQSPSLSNPPGMESDNFKLRLLKSNNNSRHQQITCELNATNSNSGGEDLSCSSSGSSQPQGTLLPNGAILIEPPNVNRNSNRYSMPIMQSPVVVAGGNNGNSNNNNGNISNNANNNNSQQQLQLQQLQQQPVIMNENGNLKSNQSLVGKMTTAGVSSDFIQFDKNVNNMNQQVCKTIRLNYISTNVRKSTILNFGLDK
jgi:hypothetical protein